VASGRWGSDPGPVPHKLQTLQAMIRRPHYVSPGPCHHRVRPHCVPTRLHSWPGCRHPHPHRRGYRQSRPLLHPTRLDNHRRGFRRTRPPRSQPTGSPAVPLAGMRVSAKLPRYLCPCPPLFHQRRPLVWMAAAKVHFPLRRRRPVVRWAPRPWAARRPRRRGGDAAKGTSWRRVSGRPCICHVGGSTGPVAVGTSQAVCRPPLRIDAGGANIPQACLQEHSLAMPNTPRRGDGTPASGSGLAQQERQVSRIAIGRRMYSCMVLCPTWSRNVYLMQCSVPPEVSNAR